MSVKYIPNNPDCESDKQPTAVKCDNDKRYYYSAFII